jgi:transposase InsO family protein
MAKKVLSMKVIAAVTAFVAGEPINVTRVCQEANVSRKTFYKWADRYRTDGLVGFTERSRAPLNVPNRTSSTIEEAVLRERERLAVAGLDHGATTVHWHLTNHLDDPDGIPSIATIHRIMVRHGLITAQPHKRPKGSWQRFEAPAPNEWWQIDATEWVISTGIVRVFNIIDDHSRVAVRSRAVTHATTEHAWTTFTQAAQQWGLPAGVLSDNGLCFSGRLRGFEVFFEAKLRDAGIRPITGRPFHPQTTGKIERFQQTLKKWLRKQPLAKNISVFQTQLDTFTYIYNNERPHQGIGRITPTNRWHQTPPATPGEPIPHPTFPKPSIQHITVGKAGNIAPDRTLVIGLGTAYAGQTATLIIDQHHATIYINDQLIRHLTLDRTRRYQPTHKPPGRPRQQPIAS